MDIGPEWKGSTVGAAQRSRIPCSAFDESRETDLQLSVDLALASEQPFLIYKLPLRTFTHSSRENSTALPKAFQDLKFSSSRILWFSPNLGM